MHVSSKEVDKDGVHIITDVLEADGAAQLASPDAKLSASVISVARTESGGVQVQVALSIAEPVIEPPKAPEPEAQQPSAEEQALAFLAAQGKDEDEAKEALAKFGAQRILAKRDAKLEEELDSLVK